MQTSIYSKRCSQGTARSPNMQKIDPHVPLCKTHAEQGEQPTVTLASPSAELEQVAMPLLSIATFYWNGQAYNFGDAFFLGGGGSLSNRNSAVQMAVAEVLDDEWHDEFAQTVF